MKNALDQLRAGSTDYHSLRPDVWKFSHPQFVRMYRTEERLDTVNRTRLTRAQRRLGNAKKQNTREEWPGTADGAPTNVAGLAGGFSMAVV